MQHWPFLSAGDCRYSRKLKENLGTLHIAYVWYVSYVSCSELDPAWPGLTRLDQVSDAHAYLQVPVFLRWEVESGRERNWQKSYQRQVCSSKALEIHSVICPTALRLQENQYDSRARTSTNNIDAVSSVSKVCAFIGDQAEINDLKSRSTSCETRRWATRGKFQWIWSFCIKLEKISSAQLPWKFQKQRINQRGKLGDLGAIACYNQR